MKKIAIVLDKMFIGGIQKACASFVNQLIEYYDVTMIMKRDDGELMSLLPKDVHVQLMPRYSFRDIAKKLLAERRFFHLLKYAVSYLYRYRICNRYVKANEMNAREAGIFVGGEFDCAIAYHGMNIVNMVTVLHNISAKKKVAWIHGDHPFEGVHKKDAGKVYQEFDKIYCVSPKMRERFLSDFPGVSGNTESYKNILEVERIKALADEYTVDFDNSFTNIVTVGRVSPEKGQDLIPNAAKLLFDCGLKVRWYIVGDGDDVCRVKALCRDFGVENSVVFVGSKQNPYPYIKGCDIYVQPSYTEGYCMTVCEASILAKPIVLTEIAVPDGVLTHGENAITTKPDAQSIAEGIRIIADNQSMQQMFTERLSKGDFSNRTEINKLIEYLNN